MDPAALPIDPSRREQLERELAAAALALLEHMGTAGVCLRLPAELPGEAPAWVVAGSAEAIAGLAPDGADGRDSLDPG